MIKSACRICRLHEHCTQLTHSAFCACRSPQEVKCSLKGLALEPRLAVSHPQLLFGEVDSHNWADQNLVIANQGVSLPLRFSIPRSPYFHCLPEQGRFGSCACCFALLTQQCKQHDSQAIARFAFLASHCHVLQQLLSGPFVQHAHVKFWPHMQVISTRHQLLSRPFYAIRSACCAGKTSISCCPMLVRTLCVVMLAPSAQCPAAINMCHHLQA